MIITISGQPGAGSTTISKSLSKKINYKLITIGEINKQIAREQGMTIEQFWKHLEKQPKELEKFHKQLDEKQKKLAEEDNIILNGKLSAFQIPQANLKILIIAELEIRAQRTMQRDGGLIEQARKKITQREQMERKDWEKIYGFDYIADKEYYNMIIDASELTPEQITKAIIQQMKTTEE